LKISTIFFAFLAAFSPRTMNSRYVNSFFTSSRNFHRNFEGKACGDCRQGIFFLYSDYANIRPHHRFGNTRGTED
ncbi:hypothetical protein L0Y46_01450, partial [bacterium]|nr:hypothetical protein [bacterium]